jgi:hypothetical protein
MVWIALLDISSFMGERATSINFHVKYSSEMPSFMILDVAPTRSQKALSKEYNKTITIRSNYRNSNDSFSLTAINRPIT